MTRPPDNVPEGSESDVDPKKAQVKFLGKYLEELMQNDTSTEDDQGKNIRDILYTFNEIVKVDLGSYGKYKIMVYAYFDKKIDNIQFSWASDQNKTLEKFNKKLKKLYELSFPGYEKPSEIIKETENELIKFIADHPDEVKGTIDEWLSRLQTSTESKIKDYSPEEHSKVLEALAINDREGNIKIVKGEDGYNVFSKEFEGENWILEKYTTGANHIVIFNEKNPKIFVVLPWNDIADRLENKDFKSVVKMAQENYKRENENIGELKSFDLPRDEKISYLRVFPETYDATVSTAIQGSCILGETLRNNYKNLENHPAIFSDYPKAELRKSIEKQYKKGCRYFFLDIYNHGTEDEIAFREPLKASDFADIIKDFPDAKFVISTVACHGGGLRKGFLEMFKDNPELAKRISVFLQAKPNVVNIGGKLGAFSEYQKYSDEIFSTYYYLFLIEALRGGKSYGEAVIYADQKNKQYIYNDPEAIIQGDLITKISPEFMKTEGAETARV